MLDRDEECQGHGRRTSKTILGGGTEQDQRLTS